MKGMPKGVWFQKKRLADGRRVRYGYYGRGPGAVPLGREGTKEFIEALADAIRREPKSGSLANIIWQYKLSDAFKKLAPRTRQDYGQQLDKIPANFRTLSYRALQSRDLIGYLYEWRDEMGATSAKQANYACTVLKLVLAWAVKRGIIDTNVAAKVDQLQEGDRRDKSWTDKQIGDFLAVAPETLQWAMILAIETGQRQADLLALTWSAVKDGTVSLKQKKTGRYVSVAISERLQACLDQVPRRAVTILTRGDGVSWEPKGNGFRAAWRAVCETAGVVDLTFHDLRGTFVTNRLADGWSREDVATATGHSLRNLAMLDVYADREKLANATAKRIKSSMKGGVS